MPTAATPRDNESTARATSGTQFLSFTLGREDYAVDILRVREIRGWQPVTRVPNAPPHLLGVLNLRGVIVPVVDMRRRFRLKEVEYNPTTVIIVLSVQGASGTQVFGIVVDGVCDVLDVAPSDVKARPDLGTAVNADFISGLVTAGDRMIMLLDIDRLLSSEELDALEQARGQSS